MSRIHVGNSPPSWFYVGGRVELIHKDDTRMGTVTDIEGGWAMVEWDGDDDSDS